MRVTEAATTMLPRLGDRIHVKLSCYLRGFGNWARGPLEVVEVGPRSVVIVKPGATSRWTVEICDITDNRFSRPRTIGQRYRAVLERKGE